MKKSKLIPLIIAGAFFAVVGGVGLANANNLYPNTVINEVSVGGRSIEELDIKSEVSIRMGNEEKSINLNDLNYSSQYSKKLEEIKKSQVPFLYIFNFTGENKYEVNIDTKYDKDKLREKIDELTASDDKPQNAYISFTDNHFEIVNEVEGNQYNSEKAYEIISRELDNGIILKSIDISEAKESPDIKSDNKELNDNLKRLNALANNTLTIDVEDATEKVEKVGQYISYENNKPVINKEKTEELLDSLAEKYNTLETKRKFQTTDKGEKEVGGSGIDTYGFKLNIEESTPIIEKAILNGETEPIKLSWEYPANTRNSKNGDIGDTYVEIDISRQHMWYYIDGKLFIDTDVRTGTESSAQWTPTTEGVFRILWKQRDKWFLQVGEPCHSDYWMPFNYRGEGIHDATWYSSYGGNYYKWAGSHGCINTPYNIVEKMFEKMEEDTPVIVYRS